MSVGLLSFKNDKVSVNVDVISFPGLKLGLKRRESLVQELRSVASECFDEVPLYQVLSGQKEELNRAVIALARNDEGELLGFCSALALDVPEHGPVLHLGLTCVRPKARGLKLTHKLTSKVIMHYMIKESLLKRFWITNCACVFSSLGNVAMHFDDVYPAPYGRKKPSHTHMKIAKAISELYRAPIAIDKNATFNTETFIFEQSICGTVFEKDPADMRYHHRNPELTHFYTSILDFNRGDEVLQVGHVGPLSFPAYVLRKFFKKAKNKSSKLLAPQV